MSFDHRVRAAWINKSSVQIPVYSGLSSSSIHTGGKTVNGTQIGKIWPNEFYCAIGHNDYITYTQIKFRSSSGNMVTGYIEEYPNGTTYNEASWVEKQEPYHYCSLTSSSTTPIDNSRYYTFTVKSAVTAINSTGSQSITLPAGYQVATDQSTVGVSNPHRMLFRYYRTSSSGTWKKFFPSNTKTYGFVDLGLTIGSMPNTRPVY